MPVSERSKSQQESVTQKGNIGARLKLVALPVLKSFMQTKTSSNTWGSISSYGFLLLEYYRPSGISAIQEYVNGPIFLHLQLLSNDFLIWQRAFLKLGSTLEAVNRQRNYFSTFQRIYFWFLFDDCFWLYIGPPCSHKRIIVRWFILAVNGKVFFFTLLEVLTPFTSGHFDLVYV